MCCAQVSATGCDLALGYSGSFGLAHPSRGKRLRTAETGEDVGVGYDTTVGRRLSYQQEKKEAKDTQAILKAVQMSAEVSKQYERRNNLSPCVYRDPTNRTKLQALLLLQ
jgi:hypothetical protein